LDKNGRITSCQLGRFANYLRENLGVKGYWSQAACTGLPALPMRMRLVLFGRARHSVRAVFSIAIHNSPASAVATARRARKHSDSVSGSSNRFQFGAA